MNQKQQNQVGPSAELPLPTGSSEWRLRLIRPLGKVAVVIILWLVMEHLWGHPSIRWKWIGGDSPREMRSCIVLTCFGEEHFDYRYRTLVTFQRPERKVAGRVLDYLTRRFQDSAASATPHSD